VSDDLEFRQPQARQGLKLSGGDGPLTFDLEQILAALALARDVTWEVAWISAVGADGTAHPWPGSWDAPVSVDATTLARQAMNVVQVINGRFTARRGGRELVVVEAVDSSFWLVWSDDATLLDRVRATFDHVSDVRPPTEFHPEG
jgi:hypothetical protein